MSTSQKGDDEPSTGLDPAAATMLLGTIGDTTWRMFVPTIGLTILGLLADKWLGTTPWIMIVGIALGAYLAFVLVKRQLKQSKES